jgi:hypothetical protein
MSAFSEFHSLHSPRAGLSSTFDGYSCPEQSASAPASDVRMGIKLVMDEGWHVYQLRAEALASKDLRARHVRALAKSAIII